MFNPEAPAIKGVASRAVDQVYDSMVASSEARTELMAQVGGGSASDYGETKMTDMKDHLREGDISTMMPSPSNNEVARFMAQHPQAMSQISPQAHAAQVSTGYFPNAGDRSRQTVANVHATMTARMRRAGQMN